MFHLCILNFYGSEKQSLRIMAAGPIAERNQGIFQFFDLNSILS